MTVEREKSPIIPILILAATVAFGFIGYQVFRLMVAQDVATVGSKKGDVPAATGNVFKDMAMNHPKAKIQRRKNLTSLKQSYNAAPYPHNVTFGNEGAKVRLTIFTDIACGLCRAEVARVLQSVPLNKTHVVFKHAPVNEDNIKSGVFEQMARETNVLEKYHAIVNAHSGNLTDKFMMQTLSELGISYKEQQRRLIDDPGRSIANLEKDLKQAERAGIQELPTFFLNRYRMGPKTLPTDRIKEYITQLDAGKALYVVSQPSDIPLR